MPVASGTSTRAETPSPISRALAPIASELRIEKIRKGPGARPKALQPSRQAWKTRKRPERMGVSAMLGEAVA